MLKLSRVLCLIIVAVLGGAPAFATPLSIEFGGAKLERLRSSNAGQARFTEYGKRGGSTVETLTLRSGDQASSKAQIADLVRSIRAKTPGVKLRSLERAGGNDVMITYLVDRPNSGVSDVVARFDDREGQRCRDLSDGL